MTSKMLPTLLATVAAALTLVVPASASADDHRRRDHGSDHCDDSSHSHGSNRNHGSSHGHAPSRVGALVVTNPLPIAVELVTEQGFVRTLAPYARTTFASLPYGGFRLTARRTSGEFIDGELTVIRPGATASWHIDMPRTGLVHLDSDHWLGAEVRIDGLLMANLAPDGARRVDLTLGWHEVEVRDARGRELYDAWVEVKPFDVVSVSFGASHHERADGRRSDRHYRGPVARR